MNKEVNIRAVLSSMFGACLPARQVRYSLFGVFKFYNLVP